MRTPAAKPAVLILLALILLLLAAAGHSVLRAQVAPAFSHKTHAPLKMPCAKCHSGVDKTDRASFPGYQTCVTCHTTMAATQAVFPTRRVFQLPDFVFFSHRVHTAANAECAKCHGDVTAMTQLTAGVEMKMKFCVDCHKETEAAVDCYVCHELGQ